MIGTLEIVLYALFNVMMIMIIVAMMTLIGYMMYTAVADFLRDRRREKEVK